MGMRPACSCASTVSCVAWFQAWRVLNLIGAVGTFTLAVGWAQRYYTDEQFGTVQPFLLVLAAARDGEAIGLRKWGWMLLALAGVVLTSGVGTSAALAGAHPLAGPPVWGVVLAVLAASLYTVTVVTTRRVHNTAPAQIAMVQMVTGGALLALWQAPGLITHLLQGWEQSTQVPFAQTLVCVLIAGLVHTSLMYGLMYGAFQRLGAGAIAMLSFIYPAVALLVDLLWFGARPAPAQWLGMGLIVAAVVGYRWQALRGQQA